MANFPSHQNLSLTSSSLMAFQKTAGPAKAFTVHISQFSGGISGASTTYRLFLLKTTEIWTVSGAHFFNSTFYLACSWTNVLSADILSEWWSEMHGFCYSEMLPFHLVICTFWVLVFSRTNRLSLTVENCILSHNSVYQPTQHQSQLQSRNHSVDTISVQLQLHHNAAYSTGKRYKGILLTEWLLQISAEEMCM